MRLASAIVLLSAVALQGQTQRPPYAPRVGTASLRGRVIAAANDSPLRNARVELQLDNRPFSIVLTDADGRFTAAALPAGSYILSAAKPGYVKTTLSTSIGTPRRVDVAEGAAIQDLEIPLRKAGAISGRIVDDTGEPIIGALVTADSVGDNGRTSAAGETDDLGVYRIGGLPQGRFIVTVALPPGQLGKGLLVVGAAGPIVPPGAVARARSRLYYPGVAQLSEALPIEVLEGEERAPGDFAVPFSQLTGDVVIGGARFSGDVTIVGSIGIADAITVAGRPADTQATAEIRGRIVRVDGRPISRAQVRLEPLDASRVPLGTLTNDDGSYEFVKLRATEYTLTASKRGYIDVEYGQRRAFERGEAIRLVAGEKRERTDISLPRYGTIAGRVLDENGDAIEGARVQVLQVRFAAGRQRLLEVQDASKQTDDLGHYRVHAVPPGLYVVRATIGQVDVEHTPFAMPMADVPGYAPTYYPGTARASDARLVTVGVSEDLADMDFSMARVPTARISGRAFTSSGETVKGGLLLLPSERSGSSATLPLKPHRMFAPDGSFEFSNVPPGEYVIQATMGRPTLKAEGEFAAQYVAVNGTDIDDLVIRTSPGSTIGGRVTFEGGDPPRPGEIGLSPVPMDADSNPPFGVGPLAAGPPGRADVHDDWTFEIVGISGSRRLRLTDPPAGWALKAIYLNGADVTDQTFTFGRQDQSLRDLQVVLTNQATAIEGTVADASGRLVRDCLVVAFPLDREARSYQSRFLDHSVCQRDGTFVIRRLPPGEYLVAAVGRRSDEGAGEWQDPQLLEAIVPRATRMALAEGQRVAITLRINPR